MISLYDEATTQAALALSLDPSLLDLLTPRIALYSAAGLTAMTHYLVIQPGDTEADIEREAGFSPFVDPLSGLRHDQPGYQPGWDHLSARGGYHRLVFTFGSTHATVLLVPDDGGALADLCRRYA